MSFDEFIDFDELKNGKNVDLFFFYIIKIID